MQLLPNGRQVSVDAAPGESLLQVLRERCGLRAMKDGCAPEGSCGACTVIVDGRAVVSCAQPASRVADGHVITLEGLSPEARAVGGFVRGDRRSPVRLLLAGHRDEDPRAPRAGGGAFARGDRASAGREPVPLHRLRQDHRRDRAGRRSAPRGSRPEVDRSGGIGSRAVRYRAREFALGERPFVNDLAVPRMLLEAAAGVLEGRLGERLHLGQRGPRMRARLTSRSRRTSSGPYRRYPEEDLAAAGSNPACS